MHLLLIYCSANQSVGDRTKCYLLNILKTFRLCKQLSHKNQIYSFPLLDWIGYVVNCIYRWYYFSFFKKKDQVCVSLCCFKMLKISGDFWKNKAYQTVETILRHTCIYLIPMGSIYIHAMHYLTWRNEPKCKVF